MNKHKRKWRYRNQYLRSVHGFLSVSKKTENVTEVQWRWRKEFGIRYWWWTA
jgi:hypothetical protein